MKKVLILLALTALAGASFAAGVNDPEVTLSDWYSPVGNAVSDLTDAKGFTATDTGNDTLLFFMSDTVSNWLYNPNETVKVTVEEDFCNEDWVNVHPNPVVKISATANEGNGTPSLS